MSEIKSIAPDPKLPTTYELCRKVKEMVDANMVWTEDAVVFGVVERWVSHAKWILDNNHKPKSKIRDDCDGFALTSAELLIHYGVKPEHVRIVFCDIKGLGGHLICCVDDPVENDTWVLDNNQSRVVSWKSIHDYDYISSLRLSDKDTIGWREIPKG